MIVRIFVTGGTFDKEYDELEGRLYFRDTHLPEMLELGRCKVKVDIRTLMMIDSLEMTELDRKTILDNCLKCKEDCIVITHGTDTMEETARVLGESSIKKTIVLTGAWSPSNSGVRTDCSMGGALAFAQSLPQDVYIAMNGRYFRWDSVQKNRKTGNLRKNRMPDLEPSGAWFLGLFQTSRVSKARISFFLFSIALSLSISYSESPTPSGQKKH
jgi:L-asparaginase